MKVLTIDEFYSWERERGNRLITVKPGVLQGAVVLLFYFLMLLVGYELYFRMLPYALAVILMLVLGFVFWLQLVSVYRQLSRLGWVLLVYEGYLAVKPRSVLNEYYDKNSKSNILLLRDDEIISISTRSGLSKVPDASGGTLYEYFKVLDIKVKDKICTDLEKYFDSEQKKWMSFKKKFIHFPVVFSGDVISVNWLGTQYMLSPRISRFVTKVDGIYSFSGHHSFLKEFDDSVDGVRECLQRGSFVNAVRLVRQSRGCSLVEAVRVVRSAMK